MAKKQTKREFIEEQLSFWLGELDKLQKKCSHKRATCEYKASTGNYDPSQDSYWAEISCPTCGKQWIAESDNDEYTKYPRKKV
jgi:hypothetical protein